MLCNVWWSVPDIQDLRMQIDRSSGTVLDFKAWNASTWSVVAWSAKAWRATQSEKKHGKGHGSGRIAHLFYFSSTIASCPLASAGHTHHANSAMLQGMMVLIKMIASVPCFLRPAVHTIIAWIVFVCVHAPLCSDRAKTGSSIIV